jgi:hypothetical protein
MMAPKGLIFSSMAGYCVLAAVAWLSTGVWLHLGLGWLASSGYYWVLAADLRLFLHWVQDSHGCP